MPRPGKPDACEPIIYEGPLGVVTSPETFVLLAFYTGDTASDCFCRGVACTSTTLRLPFALSSDGCVCLRQDTSSSVQSTGGFWTKSVRRTARIPRSGASLLRRRRRSAASPFCGALLSQFYIIEPPQQSDAALAGSPRWVRQRRPSTTRTRPLAQPSRASRPTRSNATCRTVRHSLLAVGETVILLTLSLHPYPDTYQR